MTSVLAAITALCMTAMATLVGLGPSGIGVGAAAAAAPLDCSTATVYSIGAGAGGANPQGLYSLATSGLGGASVPATLVATDPAGATGAINALGITANGTAAYWVNRGNGDVYEYLAATGVVSNVGASHVPTANLGSLVAGALNPANGFFYYAYANGTGTMVLYAFDTATNTSIGQVATASAPGFSNGDIAFDGGGNLYWVGSSGATAELGVIPGPIPTTAGNAALTGKTVATYTISSTLQFDGIAFDDAGNLYLQELDTGTSITRLVRVDPLSGATTAGPTNVSPAIRGTDLGSCATTPSLSLKKNVVGRVQASDQFTLAITGPGITGAATGATATTTGAATGVQTRQAGPLPVVSGNTYTLTETPSGTTNFSSYTSTYSCVNTATSAVVQTGSGTSITLVMPAPTGANGPPVVCTFTNAPLTSPALSIVKSASATPNPVTAAGQTVTYHFAVTNTGGTALTNVHVTDTQTRRARWRRGRLASRVRAPLLVRPRRRSLRASRRRSPRPTR